MTSNPASVGPRVLEAIAHNLCSLHDFDPAFVMGQERFARAVITEYERACPVRAPHPDREAEPTGGVVRETVAEILVNQTPAGTFGQTHEKSLPVARQVADVILQALSVSPPVVEGSSAEGADTHRAAGWPVHVFTGHGDLEQQRQQARASETYKRGDMVMAWVNEGDLYANPNVVLEAARHQPTTPGEQDIEDVISDAIGDSMDMDWTYRDGARSIMRAFEREGWVVMQNGASNPPVDAELGITTPGEQGEEG